MNPGAFQPIVQDVKPGTYQWCSCGQSKSQPFCDGSHGSSGMFPKSVQITDAKKIAWCVCKATGNPPFCDGSHKSVGRGGGK